MVSGSRVLPGPSALGQTFLVWFWTNPITLGPKFNQTSQYLGLSTARSRALLWGRV